MVEILSSEARLCKEGIFPPFSMMKLLVTMLTLHEAQPTIVAHQDTLNALD